MKTPWFEGAINYELISDFYRHVSVCHWDAVSGEIQPHVKKVTKLWNKLIEKDGDQDEFMRLFKEYADTINEKWRVYCEKFTTIEEERVKRKAADSSILEKYKQLEEFTENET